MMRSDYGKEHRRCRRAWNSRRRSRGARWCHPLLTASHSMVHGPQIGPPLLTRLTMDGLLDGRFQTAVLFDSWRYCTGRHPGLSALAQGRRRALSFPPPRYVQVTTTGPCKGPLDFSPWSSAETSPATGRAAAAPLRAPPPYPCSS